MTPAEKLAALVRSGFWIWSIGPPGGLIVLGNRRHGDTLPAGWHAVTYRRVAWRLWRRVDLVTW